METQSKPSVKLDGLTFFPVPKFNKLLVAFGAEEKHYFKRYSLPDVPREWEDFAHGLMFKGGALPEMSPKVDRDLATKAVRAWLSSFAPAHESKIATVAYALWVWTTMDNE